MNEQVLSWVLTVVGLTGFFLAGNKVWWAWYINIANQVVWVTYALVANEPAFLIGAAVYFVFFTRNAVKWTKEHRGNNIDQDELYDFDNPCVALVEHEGSTFRCHRYSHPDTIDHSSMIFSIRKGKKQYRQILWDDSGIYADLEM